MRLTSPLSISHDAKDCVQQAGQEEKKKTTDRSDKPLL
jgi:hypothetical protein